jgi:hypothetical protein
VVQGQYKGQNQTRKEEQKQGQEERIGHCSSRVRNGRVEANKKRREARNNTHGQRENIAMEGQKQVELTHRG